MIKVTNKIFKIEQLKNKPAIQILNYSCDLINSTGCIFWIAYGTALGLWRDGKIIDNDTDLDIDIISNDHIDIIKNLFKKNFQLIRITEDKQNGYIYQLAFLDNETNIILDLTFLKEKRNFLVTEAEYSGKYSYPISFISELGWFKLNKHIYSIINPELYLKYVYGSNWKFPLSKKETKYYWGNND